MVRWLRPKGRYFSRPRRNRTFHLYQRQNRYFYASTGAELEDYTATEKMIIIKIKDDKWSKYRVQFIGKGENRDKCGRLLREDFGKPATYQIKGDEGYVRANVNGSNGKVAWTQPVIIGKA